eukprot:2737598-Rhodomonas_salina.1
MTVGARAGRSWGLREGGLRLDALGAPGPQPQRLGRRGRDRTDWLVQPGPSQQASLSLSTLALGTLFLARSLRGALSPA